MSIPTTMQAMAYHEYGEDVLRRMELPVPKVGPGEVLVAVRSASVNPVDWKLMAGGLDALMDVRFPVVPGWDVSGVVAQVGIDTPEFAEGQHVMAYARKDYVHGGTCAEYVVVPARSVAAKPAELDWHSAAGLPLAGLRHTGCCAGSGWARTARCSCTAPPEGSAPWACRSRAPSVPG